MELTKEKPLSELKVEREKQQHIPVSIEVLGQQLVEKDLQVLELQQENQFLGNQVVDLDLRLMNGGL